MIASDVNRVAARRQSYTIAHTVINCDAMKFTTLKSTTSPSFLYNRYVRSVSSRNPISLLLLQPRRHHSSSSSGGNPHGRSIFCVNSYFILPTDSPFATAKYDAIG